MIDGTKNWITNLGIADFYVVFAVTDREAGHSHGITAFVVEADRPGFSVGKLEHKLGIRGSPTGQPIFEGVRVPDENVIGEPGQGFKVAMATLDRSRLGVAAQALGIAQGATDYAAAYARERRQFGQPINSFQAIQFKLADMETQCAAARELLYQACAKVDRGDPDVGKYSAMAKLFCSDVAMRVTVEAVQVLGGYGYVKEYPVERMMRDAKITQIYEGTNEIQRLVIARTHAVAMDVRAANAAPDPVLRAGGADGRARGGQPDRRVQRTRSAVRVLQGLAVFGAGAVIIGGAVVLAMIRLAGWRDPISDEEFDAIVERAERLAAEDSWGDSEDYEGHDDEDEELIDPYNEEDFKALVRAAIDDLPLEFHRALEHVAVVVSDGGSPAPGATACTRAAPSHATTSTTGS